MNTICRLLLTLLIAAPVATYAAWPDKPIRMVVPYPAGGNADTIARLIATNLGERLKTPIVVDNKPGASGTIGATDVARSAPDGNTLLLDATAMSVNPSMMEKLPFSYEKDFEPISLIVLVPNLLVVPAQAKEESIAQLIARARANPGKVVFASAGNGTAQHLAGELFAAGLKLDMVHAPYKGGAPALTDLIGGHTDMMFSTITSSYPLVKGGKLKVLATTGAKRADSLPAIPTVAESGLPDFQVYEWNGLFAPAGTPKAIVDRLEKETREIVALPAVRAKMIEIGAQPVGSSSKELGAFVKKETARWAAIIKARNIKPD